MLTESGQVEISERGNIVSKPLLRNGSESIEGDTPWQEPQESGDLGSREDRSLVATKTERAHDVNDARRPAEAAVALKIDRGTVASRHRQRPRLGQQHGVLVLVCRLDRSDARVVDTVAPHERRD